LFCEERRRTKVIPHAFGERAVLKLMFAAMLRASRTWQRVVISDFELRQIEELRTDRRGVKAANDVNCNRIPSSDLQQRRDLTASVVGFVVKIKA
jgi:hypothetical protein